MKRLAILTARGGSKRIPRKNIRDFAGKPILAWSLTAAINSGVFDEVMVSTDDDEIAEVAQSYGATFPFRRSAETSDDYSSTADVLIEVLEMYRERGIEPEQTCCIYPTAPFITPERLGEALAKFEETGADTVLPVARFGFPIWRSFKMEGERVSFNWPEFAVTRSQDLPPAFQDTGQFYFLKTEPLVRTRQLIGDYAVGIEVPETEAQDIDTEEEWKLAELKFEFMRRRREGRGG